MKNTSKLIGLVLALIVVILAIFLVSKFNSHESARVSTVAVQSKRLRSHLQAQVRLLRRIRNQFNHHLQQSQMKKMTIRPQQ